MDVSALDSLPRTDASPANQSRRFGDGSGERFVRLLDRAEERAQRPNPRTVGRAQERDDDLRARPERPERPERPVRPERAEKEDRPERPAKAEHTEKPERPERPERPQRAARAEKTEDSRSAGDAPAQEEKPLVEEKPAGEAAAGAPAETAAAGPVVVEKIEPATSSELVKMSALALAHQVGILLAQAHAVATPTETDAQAGEIGETVKSARAASALPLPLQAQAQAQTAPAQAQPQAAENKTENFADFVLRTAANPAALAAAASDDANLKAEPKSGAKTDPKGQLLVTISQPMAVAAPVAPVAAVAVQASAQAAASKPELAIAADGGSAAAAALDDKPKQTAKPGENAPLFAQSLERAQNAAAASPAADAKARPIVVPPHEQVALHVKKAVAEGKDMIVIRLNPVELGRIEVKLEIGADGTMRAAFAAERAQTLDALKNDSRQLERALQEAGLKPDAGGLNFSLRGDNRENAQAFADMGRDFRGKQGRDDAEPGAVSRDAQAPQAAYRGARRSAGGLDLAV